MCPKKKKTFQNDRNHVGVNLSADFSLAHVLSDTDEEEFMACTEGGE